MTTLGRALELLKSILEQEEVLQSVRSAEKVQEKFGPLMVRLVSGEFGDEGKDLVGEVATVLLECSQIADDDLQSDIRRMKDIKMLVELIAQQVRTDPRLAIDSKSNPDIRRQVLAMTEGTCAYCSVPLVDGGQGSDSFVVEHVVPASCGGPDHISNYVPACSACNVRKRDGHVIDFIQRYVASNVVPIDAPANDRRAG